VPTPDADLPLQGGAILLALLGLVAMLAGLAALATAAWWPGRAAQLRRWGGRLFLLGLVLLAGALPLLW
jgi:hypothetical protein